MSTRKGIGLRIEIWGQPKHKFKTTSCLSPSHKGSGRRDEVGGWKPSLDRKENWGTGEKRGPTQTSKQTGCGSLES